eukprot:226785-Amphidinium_carterae.1
MATFIDQRDCTILSRWAPTTLRASSATATARVQPPNAYAQNSVAGGSPCHLRQNGDNHLGLRG